LNSSFHVQVYGLKKIIYSKIKDEDANGVVDKQEFSKWFSSYVKEKLGK
jgi:hypothetical protein